MSMHQLPPPLPDHQPGSAGSGRGFRTRRAIWAGAVILGLSGAGAATVWAATSTPSPSPSSTASPSTASPSPGQTGNGEHGRGNPKQLVKGLLNGGQRLHGEAVIKKSDGTFQTVVIQRGKVDSVSDTSVTVKSEDGFSQQYAINADTKIMRLPAVGPDGKVAKNPNGTRQQGSTIKASDLKTGDTVRVAGTKDGNNATAKLIVAGDEPTAGNGHGKMMGSRVEGMDADDA